MPRVVHFEIYAQDLPRAIKFYQNVFDWKMEEWAGMNYWMITTGPDSEPGINGAILERPGPLPVEGQAVIAYACTVDVPNIDDTIAKVVENGGTLALDKMPVLGIGWLAYYKDSEGNIFGMMQRDPSAQ